MKSIEILYSDSARIYAQVCEGACDQLSGDRPIGEESRGVTLSDISDVYGELDLIALSGEVRR